MTEPRGLNELVTVVSELVEQPVVPEDDFYQVGGHSLMIVQVVRRLKREHGLVLDLRAFARDTTLLALAAEIRPL